LKRLEVVLDKSEQELESAKQLRDKKAASRNRRKKGKTGATDSDVKKAGANVIAAQAQVAVDTAAVEVQRQDENDDRQTEAGTPRDVDMAEEASDDSIAAEEAESRRQADLEEAADEAENGQDDLNDGEARSGDEEANSSDADFIKNSDEEDSDEDEDNNEENKSDEDEANSEEDESDEEESSEEEGDDDVHLSKSAD
jgi:hypothetical protein